VNPAYLKEPRELGENESVVRIGAFIPMLVGPDRVPFSQG